MMEYYLLVFFGLLCVSSVKGCPINCICDELQTDCTLDSCNAELPIEYTDFLRITGKVCDNQREFLNNLTPNTIIILRSDSCVGLRNCRDDRHSKHIDEEKEETVAVTIGALAEDETKEKLDVPTQGVPFIPVETEEDRVNNGVNDDDDDGETTMEMTIETTEEITTDMTTEVTTEMITERTTEETTMMMAIVRYRTRNGDEDDHGSSSTTVTLYRRYQNDIFLLFGFS